MRVALDHLPAMTHAPGVGRYARELVRALAPLEDRPELVLARFGRGRAVFDDPALGLVGSERVRRVGAPLPRRLWRALDRIGLGPERFAGSVDLFQRILPGWPPLGALPSVRAVSELPPPGHPDEARIRAELALDDAWIVFSAAGEEALVERFGLPVERVHRTPVGCDHWVRDLPVVRSQPERPYLLVLGALRRARHPDRILDAFDALRPAAPELELVFCGGRGDAAEHLERRLSFSSGRSSVRWIAPVESELPELVAGASALVHLSEGELTPVTPLEALAAGTPVVVSDCSAFREALGDEAIYVPTPLSLRHRKAFPDQLAEAVASKSDRAACQRRIDLAARFTWHDCARRTVEVWNTIAGCRANA
ncbi:MAG: glycosyltransferase [Planctomycetota bacterium]